MKQLLEDVGEQMAEMGQHTIQTAKKQVVQGVVQSVKQQIAGSQPKTDQKIQESETDTGRQQFSQMLGDLKRMSSEEIVTAQKKDILQRVNEASKIRAELKAEQIKKQQLRANYQKIEQGIQEYRAKKEQEKKQKQAEEAQKAQQEQQNRLLKEEKKKSILSPFTTALKGSREHGRLVAG